MFQLKLQEFEFIRKTSENIFLQPIDSHNHRLSRWLAQPYKGMLLAGLKAHRNI